ncbi:helix-turn-helix domain-containing protein, partial [Salmonella enterica]|nr:helix-turn-helix domain-containing protein [Salmonella enterica]
PGWLDLVADACRHKSRAVNETAWQVLTSIQDDPMMRHRHSRVTMIAERLTRLSDAAQCARIQSSTKIELSEKDAKNQAERLSSNIELSHSGDEKTLSSKRELSGESRDCSRVRKSHHNNVRSFTQSVIKKTYVSPEADKKPLTGVPEGFVWPDGLQDILPENEQPMLAHQLNQLAQKSPSVAEQVAISVVNGWRQKRISNPVGYLLATLKQAREGKYHVEPAAPQQTPARPVVQANSSTEVQIPACPTGPHIPAGQETVKAMVARIRQQLNC